MTLHTHIILFILAFASTFYFIPHSVRKLEENGFIANDMYKPDQPEIPTNAGVIILFTAYISIAILPLMIRALNQLPFINEEIFNLSEVHLAFLLVVSIYALYGLVDDLVDIGRVSKLLLPIIFSYPLISIISPESFWVPLYGDIDLMGTFVGDITYNDLFRISVIPVYIMVVSNLVNMHSGYNGLQSGLSIIVLTTLVIKAGLDGETEIITPASAFLGGMIAFLWYNRYPARVFEGNIGALLFGSVLGCMIVIQELWWFGFFILIPHTFNYCLWVVWVYLMRKYPDKYLDEHGKHTKFGNLDEHGIIHVPNRLTLKWIPNYYFDLTEKQATLMLYAITMAFCGVGLLIF